MAARTHSRTPVARLGVVIGLLAALLVACSGQASTRFGDGEDGPTTTAAQVAAPATIPPGTTLRVGDQLDYLKRILERGGQDKDLGYQLEWSNFVGGPPMLQAFKGGAIDAGFVASTPLLFAAAQGQSIVAVADLTARLVRATAVINADPEGRAAIYQTQYGLPPERARALADRSGETSFLRLPDDIVPAQQRLSRLFSAAGQIPKEVDVSNEFDARFTDLIAGEERR